MLSSAIGSPISLIYVHLAGESMEEQTTLQITLFTQIQASKKTIPRRYMIISSGFGSIYRDASVQQEV
jgi:hypothetical protein